MAGGSLRIVLRHLRRLAARLGAEELTDRRLLQLFAAQKDEAAFAELVRRHGPLVLGVCRRVLRHEQDAEDVFQATFLVLARKAATTRWDDWVGHYLYEVAYRLAVEARRKAARRREHEKQAAEVLRAEPIPEGAMRELCAVLDEELRRLPDRYRTPMLLYYLEGQTRDRAARQLGWALRTLERRLERGRELLRARLTRRGMTLSAALLAAGLAETTAAGGATPLLVAAAVRGAASFAAGGKALAGVSTRAAALAEGALAGMAMTRLKIILVWVLVLGLAATGTGLLGQRGGSARPPEARAEDLPTPVPQGGNRPKEHDGVASRTDRYGDPLPLWALARMGTVRFRHGDAVSGLAFSPDGRTIASGSHDTSVRLWEVATGQQRAELAGHQGSVLALAVAADGRLLASAGADTTAVVWDLTGRTRPGGRHGPLSAREREALWTDLGSPDGRKAFTAVCRLAEDGRQTAAFLRERLGPAPRPDARRVARLLTDLDSERFAVREKASEELEKLGEAAEPFLRRALAGRPPLEVRRRLEQLLERLEPTRTPEGLRRLRAVEVLEHAGGPEAEGVLKDLAGGAPEARLTQEARASLKRLAGHSAARP